MSIAATDTGTDTTPPGEETEPTEKIESRISSAGWTGSWGSSTWLGRS